MKAGTVVRETGSPHEAPRLACGSYDGTTRAGTMSALLAKHRDPITEAERVPLAERLLGNRSVFEWMFGR